MDQQQQIPVETLILQVLQQLQQQQSVTNQLIASQREAQEHQRLFMQQNREAIQNIRLQVPESPETILDSVAANIKEFRYDIEEGVTFAAWFSRYDELFAKDAARLDDATKVRLLVRKLGAAEHERFVSFILPKAPKDFNFSQVVEKLKALFGAAESMVSKRYRCLQTAKAPTEDYLSYACRVNKSCVQFELAKLSEEEFKSLMFVCGLKAESDAEIRTRLLSKIEERGDVTLEQLSTECQRLMNLRHDTAMIEGSSNAVNVISGRQQKFHKFRKQSVAKKDNSPKQYSSSMEKRPTGPCWTCGLMHFSRDCTYRNHQCSDCKRYGHKEGYCGSARKSRPNYKRKSQRVTVDTKTVRVSVDMVRGRRKFIPVMLNGVSVRMQFDTASDISVISVQTWKQLGRPQVKPPSVNAKAASGDPLKLVSQFDCSISVNGVTHVGTIFVAEKDLHILGLDLIEAFHLDSVPMNAFCNVVSVSPSLADRLKAQYPQVFSTELGKCIKTTVKLELKPDQMPVFSPKRPVAYAMYSAVDDELHRLESMNIITPVDYSEWAAPIVVVRKANGSIRICGDYSTGLNEALQPHQYPLPLPQDIFVKLAHCKVFSIVDMSESYLQLEVDEATSKLLAINTHRGIFKVNRLAPGVKAAPGAFQQVVDAMLAGLQHTSGYLDDIIVGGRNEEEHWENLKALFERLQEFGFTIRLEKCSFGSRQIEYLGHLMDQHGVRPDPAKVAAIRQMPPPVDVSGVRAFLGAVNYYGKFVPNMRALRFPLDELLKAGTKFKWTSACQSVFDKFKEILSSDLLLTHYNPELEIIVAADASSVGLGATISHRFPDGSILQRWALMLLMYDFTIEYVATEKFGHVDVLSRLINQHVRLDEDYVIAAVTLEKDVGEVQHGTRSNPILSKVVQYIHQGWPAKQAITSNLTKSAEVDRHIPSISPPPPTVPISQVRPADLGELHSTTVPNQSSTSYR
ncbi:uncharacterized protein K02A2.6-like [Sabethes cyaneus]|uniref:uncharacterized protein K02A2.6-like n=1 Tax=Sabethes cyaneus TaxID=53552 RepID=UPI00237E01A9|nr:uncharacterized protein K02A2.6-like [Sabethes cyaneus]